MERYLFDKEEFWCGLPGRKIFGILYLPKAIENPPLVIFSHEMGKTHTSGTGYAESLAADGFAVYVYDIRGGSEHSRSEGRMQELSAFTAADDLNMIMDDLAKTNIFDSARMVLLGASLGGFASALTAMRHPEKTAGLILMYPGFVLIEDLHQSFETLEQVPSRFVFNKWFPVGRRFASDVWNFDPYSQIGNYRKPVLILHGDRDPLLPASWSLMAVSAYPFPDFHIIKDGQHGFRGPALDEALGYIRSYLEKHVTGSSAEHALKNSCRKD